MRNLYHFILTRVPRPILIRLSYLFNKIAPLIYAGNRFEDPIDGRKYRKLLPYGALVMRENVLAPGSLSLERHRLLWLYLQKKTNFFTAPKLKVLHIAPEQCFYKRFRNQSNLEYLTGDIESPLADVKFDLHQAPFEDNSFDVIFCNHVLEHVDDYMQCMRELKRIMKPGGWGIFQVPIDYQRSTTYEDKSITSEEDRLIHYWQKDHVRLFGNDYPQHLRNAGFEVVEEHLQKEIGQLLSNRYRLPDYEPIYLCKKS
ncbi:MAG TPA: methyltransferase domain-containing protein [Luteibaculaceae bacterium]|nr:methyltransferase domain-containing protein [Luteibaculaceae bacterium]